MKAVAANVVLVAASLLFAFVIAETAVRLGLVRDPLGDYLRVDGVVEEPTRRLLLLGDSFVDKRERTFHDRLLEQLGDARFSVANLARSGTGPAHYRDVLRQYGDRFDPDVVVLFYFAGNDLINVLRYEPRPEHRAPASVRDHLRPWVHRSRLYHTVTEIGSAPSFDFDAMLADGHDPELVAMARAGDLNPWLLLIPKDERERYLSLNLLIESQESRAAAARLRTILHEVSEETQRLGAALLLVVFPGTTQVNRSHFDFYERAGFDPEERMLTGDAPQALVRDIAAELGAPVLDLLPALRAQRDTEHYRPYDSHLNELGNDLAAREVARFLLEHVAPATE